MTLLCVLIFTSRWVHIAIDVEFKLAALCYKRAIGGAQPAAALPSAVMVFFHHLLLSSKFACLQQVNACFLKQATSTLIYKPP